MSETPEYRAFYDRVPHSILGKFSIRHRSGDFLVTQAVTRSGQAGHTQTSWVRGKSPIPYGEYRLYLHPNNVGMKAGRTGIGEFYPISNQPDQATILNPLNKKQKRTEIGLHQENALPGSAGCIVVVFETDWLDIRRKLAEIREQGYDYIPLAVM
jgi:hypothetical protein